MKLFTPMLIPLLVVLAGSTIRAQESDEASQEPKSEMLTAQVLVLDPDGNPVEEATVKPFGLRTRIEPGSHWSWHPDDHGPLPELKTNEAGIAKMPYPKYVMEKLETGTMTWSVSHPDFVEFREDRSVDDDPAEIQLVRGYRIAATAIDAITGKQIKTDLYAVLSGYTFKPWKLHANGMLVSPVQAKEQCTLRILRIEEGKPILFSESIDVNPKDRSRVLLKEVKLAKGTRVEGKLHESIERPIKNGYVCASIIRKSDKTPNDWASKWQWNDKTPIDEDGAFVFESLPPGEVLQMIPICDGWAPAKQDKKTVLRLFPNANGNDQRTSPQLVELQGAQVTPTLLMNEATSARVAVSAPDGSPLVGAHVAMYPNHIYFDGGSTILGSAWSSRKALVEIREGNHSPEERPSRFSAKTDKAGIAEINNLPGNGSEGVYVGHDNFEMLIADRDTGVRVDLKPDEVAEVTIQMQPKGTDFRGNDEDAEEDEDATAEKDAEQDQENAP